MDKKAKKKIKALRERLAWLQKKLASVREQQDEPGELEAVEEEIRACKAKIEELKG